MPSTASCSRQKCWGIPSLPMMRHLSRVTRSKKLLLPAATANIKLQGMGTMRQFPVYDNQTKQTAYMDSNEINDAKLREPGPVHGSWLHARSGNPEADRKDVRTWR